MRSAGLVASGVGRNLTADSRCWRNVEGWNQPWGTGVMTACPLTRSYPTVSA